MSAVLSDIDAVILCGGLGTRLRSVIGERPKVLAEVGGKPFLDIIVDDLNRQGFRRLVMCTGYRAQEVEACCQRKAGNLHFEFSREEEPLGTGGALKRAQGLIQSNPFFVLNGDSFCPLDFTSLLKFHQAAKAMISMGVAAASAAADFGGVTLDASKRVTHFHEKNARVKAPYVNAGVYGCQQDIFSLMPPQKMFSLEYDIFPQLAGRDFFGFEVDSDFFDIGTPERYAQAKEHLLWHKYLRRIDAIYEN